MSQDDSRAASPEALEAWVLATLPRAVAFAASLLHDRVRSEDVVHDCYVRLLSKAGTYNLLADGTKLLFKAITNACIDVNGRERRLLSLDELSADGRAIDPHDQAEHRELEAAMVDGLGRLTVAQRAALELKSLGYTLDEIAEALATSPSNAGVLVHRARKALAEQLAPFLEVRPDE
ncbi:MAG: sigma-70 family RNA polymerase sigma factor [Isosphaeraceae bacterium]|nr:sigma-70 family RNA polymerase sigma factor [Isosphaeraceae bacterium]